MEGDYNASMNFGDIGDSSDSDQERSEKGRYFLTPFGQQMYISK